LLITFFVKLYYVGKVYIFAETNNLNNSLEAIFQVLTHDSPILCFIIASAYISYLMKKSIYALFFRLLSLSIFIIYFVDLIILFIFANRLNINDLQKFIDYIPSYIAQNIHHLGIIPIIIFAIFTIVFILFLIKHISIENKKSHLLTTISLAVLLSAGLFANNGFYAHSWLFKNVIDYNISVNAQSKDYSKEFIKNFSHKKTYTVSNFENSVEFKKNIIILMVESLASYQSNLFSGINNWTPNIDKIAKNNIYFTDFHANGFTTEDAEISILTGLLPIYAPKIFSNAGGVSFNGFYDLQDTLPLIAKSKGYHTEFITSSDLNFSNTGNWARSIGFEYIEGSENRFYDGLPRFHFKAAEDKYLLQNVLNRVNINQNNKFLMFVKTVSSHVPFVNPTNLNRSEEETIKYVDQQIGIFYNELIKTNFFDNGILIIVGDHYPLIPVSNREIQIYGETKAPTKVPMIISYGNKEQSEITQYFQQTDIYNSLQNVFNHQIKTNDWNGHFINIIIPPKYIVYKRGDQRGIISVFNDTLSTNVKLSGDDTDVISKTTDDITSSIIVNKINYERISKINKQLAK
jgi:phosphoglycerol transferase MdoB-like AlkP superfamily enzyme